MPTIVSEDESLSEIRMNKNDIPTREDAVALFLKCFNNFSSSFNLGISMARPFPEVYYDREFHDNSS